MIEQTFGPRRCRDTRKPRESQCPDVKFYYCPVCKRLFPMTGGVGEQEPEVFCCGEKAMLLVPQSSEAVENQIKLDYKIVGGYNDNAVRITWKTTDKRFNPEWIYLKTFTGGYLKYVMEGKRPPMVFALADTDAFCYCDEDPCLECVFRCKRGFVIYVYSDAAGLVEIPIDKMTAHWQSGGKDSKTYK